MRAGERRILATHLEDIVLMIGVSLTGLWKPEADIFVAGRVLGVRLKRSYLSVLKLTQKSWVGGPEEADIGNREEDHRKTLQAKAKGPTHFV